MTAREGFEEMAVDAIPCMCVDPPSTPNGRHDRDCPEQFRWRVADALKRVHNDAIGIAAAICEAGCVQIDMTLTDVDVVRRTRDALTKAIREQAVPQ